jgi:hypothetical protein
MMTAAQRARAVAQEQWEDLYRRLWTRMWSPTWYDIRKPIRYQLRYSKVQIDANNALLDLHLGEQVGIRAALNQHINTTRRQS